MLILTPENTVFSMIDLPDQIDDVRYCVLDYENPATADFIFVPLVYMDAFSRPAADLKIGEHRILMPLDWSIVIADKHLGMIEIIELKNLNDRDFDALVINPISGYMPEFHEVTIQHVFPDFSWSIPKLKFGHLLGVPLSEGPDPLCAFFVKDTNKLPEVLDITKIF